MSQLTVNGIETAIVETFSCECTLWREAELEFVFEAGESLSIQIVGESFVPRYLGYIVRPESVSDVLSAIEHALPKETDFVIYVILPGLKNPGDASRASSPSTRTSLGREANALRDSAQAPTGISVVGGRGFDWADRANYRVNRTVKSVRSRAALKLVG